MNRVIARDPIKNVNVSMQISQTLYNGLQYFPSKLDYETEARRQSVFYSEENDLRKVGISGRGLLNSVRTSQAVFQPPMIQNNQELVQRYTRPVSGKKSNPMLSEQRVAIGTKIVNNLQSAYSGRLY